MRKASSVCCPNWAMTVATTLLETAVVLALMFAARAPGGIVTEDG